MITALPIFLPLAFIIFAFLFRRYHGREFVAIGFAALNLFVTVILLIQVNEHQFVKLQMGNWPAPYGITLIADRFSAIMLVAAAVVFLACMTYSVQSVDINRKSFGFYLFSFGILMGVNGSFLAGDIFNLYVWFEVILIASFVLMGHGGQRAQLEGSIKYLTLNLISSFFFVAGIGLLYGKLGTLNLADIAYKLIQNNEAYTAINPALILIFVGFAIKGALVPFFFWLPASYHTPPPVVTALFAGLITKVGIYSLMRFYTLVLYHDSGFWQPLILWVGGLSMVIGVVTATSQFEFRKVLSFHIISQVGYVVMGLGFFTVAGIAGAIFFLVHNMISKTNAFLIAGWVHQQKGTLNLKVLGGFYREHPWWAGLFFISAFSLAGLPPLSGFIGKFLLLKAGVESGFYAISLVALFVGFLTLFSMVKIWMEVFWKPAPETSPEPLKAVGGTRWMQGASTIMALIIIGLGVFASPVVEYCTQAAQILLEPERYINFVLNI